MQYDTTKSPEENVKEDVEHGDGEDKHSIVHRSFGWAVKQVQNGSQVQRVGWNGKGMFLFLINTWTYTDGKQDNYPNLPFIAMKTADNKVVPWLASQTDILALDWSVLK